MTAVPTFVDLQGFTIEKRFVVKEVAILRNGVVLSHYVFASPVSWRLLKRSDKSKAAWLMVNHHGLQWDDGVIPYSEAKRLITEAVCDERNEDCEGSRLVYVKGYEKREWLTNLLDNDVARDRVIIESIDTDYDDITSLDKLQAVTNLRCNNHTKHCALQNVINIFTWWSHRHRELCNF